MQIGAVQEIPAGEDGESADGHPVLPRYRVLGRIGEGAHGVVYLAETLDEPRIRCAVKVLRAGLDSRSAARRFEAERLALARLDHPAIVAIRDAGRTADDRPFFVMPLVTGEPVTTACAQADLGTRARIEIFLEVLGGVAHAHRRGIVHRDLKPGNILADLSQGGRRVRILDWGIARALDTSDDTPESLRTTGSVGSIGTPEFMSPEQALGDVPRGGVRGDVWSLGVLLYLLLADRLPFPREAVRGLSPSALSAHLRSEHPPRPSAVVRTASRVLELRGDLDAIVMKAIAPDPERRYRDADEFASDLRAHLEGRPVVARRATGIALAFDRLSRHRRHAAVATLALLVVLLAAALSLEAWSARARARDNADALGAFLAEILADAAPVDDPAGASERIGRAAARLSLLDAADARLALVARIAVGEAQSRIGDQRGAERTLRAAIDGAGAAFGDGDPDVHRALAGLARIVAARQDPERFALCTRVLASGRRTDPAAPPVDEASLRALVAVLGDMDTREEAGDLPGPLRSPVGPESLRRISCERMVEHIERHAGSDTAVALDARILLLRKRVDFADKEVVLETLRDLHARIKDDPDLVRQRARIDVAMSLALSQLGRPDDLGAWIEAELPELTRRLGPNEPSVLNLRFNLALMLLTTTSEPGRREGALQELIELSETYARLQDPEAPMARWIRSALLSELRTSLDLAAAEELRRRYLLVCDALGTTPVAAAELDSAVAAIRGAIEAR